MNRLILPVAIALALSPAHAQQQQSPMEQALSQKIVAELNASLQCSASLLTIQAQLQTAQSRVKELEAKYEPAAK
jgi:hypothetical protein